jgi:hypothetical protein
MATAAPAKRSLISAHFLSRFLLGARTDEDEAREAYAKSQTSETRSRLKAARLRASELASDYDRAIRHEFAAEVFRVRTKAKSSAG